MSVGIGGAPASGPSGSDDRTPFGAETRWWEDVQVGDARPGSELKEILRSSLARLNREAAVALS